MRTTLVAVLALLFAAPASGGGWATAELAPPPDGIQAGDTWTATVTILQHGRTPLDGVKPQVILSQGKTRIPVAATWTGKPGVYEAKITIPHAGYWRYAVSDGFTQFGGQQVHRFPAFSVAPAGERGFAFPIWPFLAALGVVLAGGVAYRAKPKR